MLAALESFITVFADMFAAGRGRRCAGDVTELKHRFERHGRRAHGSGQSRP